MRTGQRYIHKAAFALNLSGSQTWDNIRAWKEEVLKVADVVFKGTKQDYCMEYIAIGKWK